MTDTSPIPYADPTTPRGGAHGPRIFGKGSYSNWGTARVLVEPGKVSILPAPVPWSGVIATNALIGTFFLAWLYFIDRYVHDQPNRMIGFAAGFGTGILTLGLFTTLVVGSYRYSQRKGGWLIIDRGAGTVTLCRQNRVVPISHLLRIEHLNMWQRDAQGKRKSEENLSEVHAIFRGEDGQEERVCLLGALAGVYKKLSRELATHAGVPVLYVREHLFNAGYDVTPVEPLPRPRN